MSGIDETRLLELTTDIDVRLADVWATVLECSALLGPVLDDDDVRDAFARLLRVSYGRGYLDALREAAEGRPAELCLAHGYAPPGA